MHVPIIQLYCVEHDTPFGPVYHVKSARGGDEVRGKRTADRKH